MQMAGVWRIPGEKSPSCKGGQEAISRLFEFLTCGKYYERGF
jgi:hypothetical protein